jgi:hypothetical protein
MIRRQRRRPAASRFDGCSGLPRSKMTRGVGTCAFEARELPFLPLVLLLFPLGGEEQTVDGEVVVAAVAMEPGDACEEAVADGDDPKNTGCR